MALFLNGWIVCLLFGLDKTLIHIWVPFFLFLSFFFFEWGWGDTSPKGAGTHEKAHACGKRATNADVPWAAGWETKLLTKQPLVLPHFYWVKSWNSYIKGNCVKTAITLILKTHMKVRPHFESQIQKWVSWTCILPDFCTEEVENPSSVGVLCPLIFTY